MRHANLKNLNRKQILRVGCVCLALLALASYFYFGNNSTTTNSKTSKGNPLVSVYTVKQSDMTRHLTLSGQTVAHASIDLAPKYTGKITAINVNLGDYVEAGDILMEQDTKDLNISIKQNEAATQAASADATTAAADYNANYLQAQEAYNIEQKKYERNQYLYSIGAISKDTLDSVRETYLTSKANYEALANQNNGTSSPASVQSKVATAEKNAYAVEALKQQRDDMTLRAPSSGIIGYRNAEVGEIAQANTKVLTIIDNNHIYVDCNIAEADAALLTPNMDVNVDIDALGSSFAGKIIYVSPAMDDTNKSYTVRIALDDNSSAIKAGLFAHTQIDILQKANTLFVPKDAIVEKNGKTFVYVVNVDNTVTQHEVKIGLVNDDFEEIISGLSDGDTVATSNQDRLKDGASVDIDNSSSSSDNSGAMS